MATTSLFVEIIVVGALAELWFLALIAAMQPVGTISALLARFVSLGPLSTVVVGVLLAVTYAVGWVVNFAAERSFKYLFEAKIRNQMFGGDAASYREARALVFQNGSSDLLQDLVLDRHIIRIARSNVFNFALLGTALLLNWRRLQSGPLTAVFGACVVVASLSFAQWRTRYQAHYAKIAAAARVIERSMPALPN
jgi:hypothetical protein